jgi:hypothetical protein
MSFTVAAAVQPSSVAVAFYVGSYAPRGDKSVL